MQTDHVTLPQLAQQVGLDRSNLRKILLREKIPMVRIRTKESRGQLTLALTPENAETFRKMRREQGFEFDMPVLDNGEGWFYIVQLVPDLDEKRVKLGFAKNVQDRLNSHRTAAPTAALFRQWPCKKTWECAAIDSLTRDDCTWLASEVFTCNNLDALSQRGDDFFSLMPIENM